MANFTPVGVEAQVKNLNKFISNMGIMQGAIGGIAASITTFALNSAVQMTKALVGIGKVSVEEAVKFEDSFAGVRKTVETTEEEFERLAQSMRDLAKTTPIDVNTLNEIAELGGQLGVVDKDTEDVTGTMEKFVETIAALEVSTNLTTEAAATQLARFANIMQTTAEQGDETFSRLGSTIVNLGNNMATTESDILNFGLRVAGAGEIAGLTEANVLAIGAAMSSVGVQANAGGTAVQKTLILMNEAVNMGSFELDVFAATAGKTTEEFADLWEKDAGAAFQSFVEGLGKAGDDAVLILNELELKDQRLVRAFLSLANAGDVLGDAMTIANEGFEENKALAEEAAKKYATTASQWKIFQNNIKDVAIEFGSSLLPTLNKLMTAGLPFIQQFGGWLSDVLPGIIQGAGSLFQDQLLPAILNIGTWIQTNLIPAFVQIGTWLQTNIPIAVAAATEVWNTILLPALQETGTWIQETLIPVFNTVVGWLQQLLPIAIAELTTWWESVLLPAMASLQEQWEQNIQPALAELWAWLQERVPQAIETLAEFWENTLKPALEIIGTFIAETLIPILGQIVTWLIKNIPVAIDAAVKFWVEVLQPALQKVWAFIQENVIPVFETVVAWLQENIPVAIATLTKFWEEDLYPALEKIWFFINDHLVPLFVDLGELLEAGLTWIIQSLAITWKEDLLPALEAAWKFIKENLLPILTDLWSFVVEKLVAGFEKFKTLLVDIRLKFDEWTEKIKNFDPKSLNPFIKDSPVPFAEGLKEIGKQMSKLTMMELPQFNAQLATTAALASAPVSAMPIVPNNNVTINMGGNNIASNIDAAVFEQRVLDIVTDNIG